MRKELAAEYVEVNKAWSETDKVTIAENVRKYLRQNVPECRNSFNSIWNWVMKTTGSKKQAVYAWFNRGRKDVKVPLLKLCMIADKLNVDVMKFFEA